MRDDDVFWPVANRSEPRQNRYMSLTLAPPKKRGLFCANAHRMAHAPSISHLARLPSLRELPVPPGYHAARRSPSLERVLPLARPSIQSTPGRARASRPHARGTQEPSPRVTHTWRKNAVSPHSLRTSKEGRRRQEARRQLLFDGGLEWVAVARLRRLQRDDRRLDQCQVRRHWRLSGRPRKATRQPGGG